MTDELTYMTDAHVAVVKALERVGLGLQVEVEFPPYRVDIYLPDYHLVVEVDGPVGHSGRENDRRDKALWRAYGLRTLRVHHNIKTEQLVAEVRRTIKEWGHDAATRKEKAEMAAPWL